MLERRLRAISHGIIDPDNFTPCPKNPVIARIFKEMGLADELGSGVRNLFKYTAVFSGSRPEMLEEDIFRVIVPLTEQAAMEATAQVTEQDTEQAERNTKIIQFCKNPRSSHEIMEYIGLTHREHFRAEILKPLVEQGLLLPTIPDKPKSPKQKYVAPRKDTHA